MKDAAASNTQIAYYLPNIVAVNFTIHIEIDEFDDKNKGINSIAFKQ